MLKYISLDDTSVKQFFKDYQDIEVVSILPNVSYNNQVSIVYRQVKGQKVFFLSANSLDLLQEKINDKLSEWGSSVELISISYPPSNNSGDHIVCMAVKGYH